MTLIYGQYWFNMYSTTLDTPKIAIYERVETTTRFRKRLRVKYVQLDSAWYHNGYRWCGTPPEEAKRLLNKYLNNSNVMLLRKYGSKQPII